MQHAHRRQKSAAACEWYRPHRETRCGEMATVAATAWWLGGRRLTAAHPHLQEHVDPHRAIDDEVKSDLQRTGRRLRKRQPERQQIAEIQHDYELHKVVAMAHRSVRVQEPSPNRLELLLFRSLDFWIDHRIAAFLLLLSGLRAHRASLGDR